eukprot:g22529.t1
MYSAAVTDSDISMTNMRGNASAGRRGLQLGQVQPFQIPPEPENTLRNSYWNELKIHYSYHSWELSRQALAVSATPRHADAAVAQERCVGTCDHRLPCSVARKRTVAAEDCADPKAPRAAQGVQAQQPQQSTWESWCGRRTCHTRRCRTLPMRHSRPCAQPLAWATADWCCSVGVLTSGLAKPPSRVSSVALAQTWLHVSRAARLASSWSDNTTMSGSSIRNPCRTPHKTIMSSCISKPGRTPHQQAVPHNAAMSSSISSASCRTTQPSRAAANCPQYSNLPAPARSWLHELHATAASSA